MIFFGHEDPDGPDWSLSWVPLLTPEEQTELERMSAEMGRQAGRYVDRLLAELLASP